MSNLTGIFFCLALICIAKAQDYSYQKIWYDGECGVSKYTDAGEPWSMTTPQAAAVGGKAAREHEFPWAVAIRFAPGDEKWDLNCIGTLINREWVLTAAHCVAGRPLYSLVAVIGEHAPAEANVDRQFIGFDYYVFHPNWGQDMWYEADLTLVHLATPANLSDNVVPVCAPDASYDYAGDWGVVTGWGELTAYQWDLPDELQWLAEVVLHRSHCQKVMNGVTEHMECVGSSPQIRATCAGDGGAPLTVKKPNGNGKWELVGTFAWTYGCDNWSPQMYTRVASYIDWITETIS